MIWIMKEAKTTTHPQPPSGGGGRLWEPSRELSPCSACPPCADCTPLPFLELFTAPWDIFEYQLLTRSQKSPITSHLSNSIRQLIWFIFRVYLLNIVYILVLFNIYFTYICLYVDKITIFTVDTLDITILFIKSVLK